MKAKLCVGTALLFLVGGCALATERPLTPVVGQHSQQLQRGVGAGTRYLLFLPESYGTENKQWPLILFLHGAGERGDDLEKVKVHGPPKIVEQRPDFPFIVVSPQVPENGTWSTPVLDELLDEVVERYAVDPDRIYVTGLSMGGYGTWKLAIEYPERFAAIAPIAGGGERWAACSLGELPVWVFHGAKDEVVPPDRSETMVEALRRCGAEPKYTVYPEAGHDSWTATYDNPELYDWFLQHQRGATGQQSSPGSDQ